LWQVAAAGLDETFPALRVVPADHHNLTAPLTSIVGRDAELEQLARVALASKAVTIVGPGGVGKTRLAVEHGLRALDEWPDGVWFVDLSAVDDGGLVPAAIAGALGVRTPADSDALSEVVERLSGKKALLILDNVEQVREAVARAVATILQRSRRVGIMSTGREPLGWRAETVVRLGPLSSSAAPSGGSAPPAVELFLDRATTAGAAAIADDGSVAELCRRLDGLPLAIEMAAARAAVLTPREILTGLADAAAPFASRDPTMSERHRSLDHLLAWSDRLLDAEERSALRVLSVFAGPFGYETAAAAAGNAHGVPDLVWSLANKSLLYADSTAGATRYRFPETVRSFARRSDQNDEVRPAARRLAAWYLERIGPPCSLDQAWVGLMGDEIDNLRGLVALLGTDDQPTAQRLAWSIGQYHDLRQGYRHGIEELTRHAAQLGARTPERVGLLTLLAKLRLRVGADELACDALKEARDLQQLVGAVPWDDVAVERIDGELLMRAGDHLGAARLAEEVLARELSDRGRGRMWGLLGIARAAGGDDTGAAAALEFELALWQRLGIGALQVTTHGNIAEALLRSGDLAGAARHQRGAMRMALEYGQPLLIAYSWMVAARLAAADGEWATAVRLQTAADEMLAETGHVMYPDDRAVADAVLVEARQQLGPGAFEDEQRRARSTTLDDLVALAEDVFATVEQTRMETHA
jgi:predicted ATPase